jgi:hypothetical protein
MKKTTTKPKAKKTTAKAKTKTGSKKTTGKKAAPKVVESNHIIAILDRSGSMRPVATDAIGGYNTFLDEQKKLKDNTTMSVFLFDDHFTPLYDGKKIALKEVPELTDKVFIPRGMTALYDAIGKSVQGYKTSISTQKNVNEKVLVLIVTDGADNDSKEFSKKDIADLIAYQKTQNWEFIFMCSTEDALTVGAGLNISAGNNHKFQNTADGNKKLFKKVAKATASYRSMTTFDAFYAPSEDGVLMSAKLMADAED